MQHAYAAALPAPGPQSNRAANSHGLEMRGSIETRRAPSFQPSYAKPLRARVYNRLYGRLYGPRSPHVHELGRASQKRRREFLGLEAATGSQALAFVTLRIDEAGIDVEQPGRELGEVFRLVTRWVKSSGGSGDYVSVISTGPVHGLHVHAVFGLPPGAGGLALRKRLVRRLREVTGRKLPKAALNVQAIRNEPEDRAAVFRYMARNASVPVSCKGRQVNTSRAFGRRAAEALQLRDASDKHMAARTLESAPVKRLSDQGPGFPAKPEGCTVRRPPPYGAIPNNRSRETLSARRQLLMIRERRQHLPDIGPPSVSDYARAALLAELERRRRQQPDRRCGLGDGLDDQRRFYEHGETKSQPTAGDGRPFENSRRLAVRRLERDVSRSDDSGSMAWRQRH